MTDDEIEELRAVREELYCMAKHALRYVGLSRYEWETEPQTINLARKVGIEHELTHISAMAAGSGKGI